MYVIGVANGIERC